MIPEKVRSGLKHSSHDHEGKLKAGEFIKAPNRDIYLVMQNDGNLCLYPSKARTGCMWASDTNESGRGPHHLAMQGDGNLVIYDADNKPVWATNTNGRGPNCYLDVQDDGNVVLYTPNK